MYNGSHGLQFLSYLILPALAAQISSFLLHIKWSIVKDGKRQPKWDGHESWSFHPKYRLFFFFSTAILCSLCVKTYPSESALECPNFPVLHSAFYLEASIMVSRFISVCYPSFHCPLLHILGHLFLVIAECPPVAIAETLWQLLHTLFSFHSVLTRTCNSFHVCPWPKIQKST